MSSKSMFYPSHKPWRVPAKILSGLLLLSLLLTAQGAAPAHAASIIRVTPGGLSSGACGDLWTHTCTLQHALADVAQAGDQVWVKRGTYAPTVGSSPSVARTETFALKNGVSIYGGFLGNEVALGARNPASYPSILSGDIGTVGVATDNSYHVVRAGAGIDSSARLDGFTITAGYAWVKDATFGPSAASDDWSGGGMFIEGRDISHKSSPTLANLIFSGNTAVWGGGLATQFSDSSLTNVTFTGNVAQANGGGMGNYNSSLILTNVTFYGNKAGASATYLTGVGGGMNNGTNSSPTLTNVTFSGNSAGTSATTGGAMSGETPTIYDSIFWGDTPSEFANLSSAVISDSILAGGCPSGATCPNMHTFDPLLGPLANNGGFTPTMSLATGSPAIDAGNDTTCALTDQRGVTRPVGAHCDIGAVEYSPITISGNAGVASATLSYTDGTPQTVTAAAGPCPCNYTITVPFGWTGTVTPSQVSYAFTPDHRTYAVVTVNQTAQNYVAVAAHEVDVYVHGAFQGSYLIPVGGSQRVNYGGLDSGPVRVVSTDATPIIAAERDAWKVSGVITSFAQLMGLPAGQVSDTYFFPAYNNVTLDEQLRFGNVDTVDTTVTVTIGGVVRGTYLLHPNESVRVNYAGLDSGPVVVQGTPGVHIIAAERDAWMVSGGVTSFVQLMGLPAGAVSDTYVFPAYNNVTLDEQLRFGNVDTVPTTVTVTIGGIPRGSYPLLPGQAVRVNYSGVDSGPVVVQGTAGVNIIAAERDAWYAGAGITSFAQLMGLPTGQVSDTYVFPAYNNVTLDEQLRFGNVDTVDTTVTVTIGGVLKGTYLLHPSQAVRVNYAGLDSGPVVVQGTAGVRIIAAERDAWKVSGGITSFVQLMGLPAPLESDTYWFPAYNNVALDEQLRFGVP